MLAAWLLFGTGLFGVTLCLVLILACVFAGLLLALSRMGRF